MVWIDYSIEQQLTWQGSLELTDEEYEKTNGMKESELFEYISDLVDMREPTDWDDGTVDIWEESSDQNPELGGKGASDEG